MPPPPAPEPEAQEIAEEVIVRKPRLANKKPKRSPIVRALTLVLGLVLAIGTAIGAFYGGLHLRDRMLADDGGSDTSAQASNQGDSAHEAEAPEHLALPRRALAIGVHQYLYANPVSPGGPNRDLIAVMDRVSRTLRIPAGQTLVLSDVGSGLTSTQLLPLPPPPTAAGAKPPKAKKAPAPVTPPASTILPSKAVIEYTIKQFLETSRSQDRILILFVGHAVTIEDANYLVPLEGSLEQKESLIPLDWLFEQLKNSQVRQKVLVLDICRFDPTRGESLVSGGSLSAKLEEQLKKAPEGVQIWCATSKDQYSYECEGYCVFLSSLFDIVNDKELRNKPVKANDLLPIEDLAERVGKKTTDEVKRLYQQAQTPTLFGKAPETGASFKEKEPLPPKLSLPPAPDRGADVANSSEITSIVQEIPIPQIPVPENAPPMPPLTGLVSFLAKDLAPYRSDGRTKEENKNREMYPLRAGVLEAVEKLQMINTINFRTSLSEGSSERLKKEIAQAQEKPALVIGELSVVLDSMRQLEKDRKKETSKRWQAHYDFVLAELLSTIASLSEYSLMLGKIRRDELPTPIGGRPSFRIASRSTMQGGKDFKDQMAEAHKLFTKVIKENPGTPWEVLAKRELARQPGLEWKAVPAKTQ